MTKKFDRKKWATLKESIGKSAIGHQRDLWIIPSDDFLDLLQAFEDRISELEVSASMGMRPWASTNPADLIKRMITLLGTGEDKRIDPPKKENSLHPLKYAQWPKFTTDQISNYVESIIDAFDCTMCGSSSVTERDLTKIVRLLEENIHKRCIDFLEDGMKIDHTKQYEKAILAEEKPTDSSIEKALAAYLTETIEHEIERSGLTPPRRASPPSPFWRYKLHDLGLSSLCIQYIDKLKLKTIGDFLKKCLEGLPSVSCPADLMGRIRPLCKIFEDYRKINEPPKEKPSSLQLGWVYKNGKEKEILIVNQYSDGFQGVSLNDAYSRESNFRYLSDGEKLGYGVQPLDYLKVPTGKPWTPINKEKHTYQFTSDCGMSPFSSPPGSGDISINITPISENFRPILSFHQSPNFSTPLERAALLFYWRSLRDLNFPVDYLYEMKQMGVNTIGDVLKKGTTFFRDIMSDRPEELVTFFLQIFKLLEEYLPRKEKNESQRSLQEP